ncbi:MAG: hypothetical protein OES13_04265 [Acidimicrobiia bacterium]|nr:hypothetical protein [Acidimicrobiia bacterium]
MNERPDLPEEIDFDGLSVPEHRPGFWDDVEQGWRDTAGRFGLVGMEGGDREEPAMVGLHQDKTPRRRSPLLVAMVAAVSVLLVGSATALLLRPAGERESQSPVSLAATPTTSAAVAKSTSTTTTTIVTTRVIVPTAAPWTLSPLTLNETPRVLVDQWESAENQLWCSALAPAFALPEAEDAVARAAYFGGGWAVAWDKPNGPGSTGTSEYCEDCGRSAFGVAGVGLTVKPNTASRLPDVLEWPDGSLAGYTGLGFEVDNPKRLAELVVEGQGCIYQVWSHLGDDHLVRLIESLRFVEGLQADPVTLRQPGDPQTVIDAGAEPWYSHKVSFSDTADVLQSVWQQATPQAVRVTFADLGEGMQDAQIRTANLGAWGVAWDNPAGPGHDGLNNPCKDCGRGAVGLGQRQSRSEAGRDVVAPPFRVEWDDGSYAEFGSRLGGHSLPLDRLRFIDETTEEAIEGALEANLVIAGTEAEIVVWTHLGQEHLLYLLSQIRFVD